MPCEMVKLRKASFRLIEEISTEKNSEKLRVLNIMKDDLKERIDENKEKDILIEFGRRRERRARDM